MCINDNSSALFAEKPLFSAVSSLLSNTDQDPAVRSLQSIVTDAPIVTQYLSVTDDIAVFASFAVDPAVELAIGADTIEFWAPRIKGTAVKTVASIVEVGSLLLQAKAALPHGSYEKMLVTELGPSDRKWRNYTRIAKNQVLANRHNYAVLPGSIVQLTNLARLHDDDLQEILTEVRARMDRGEKINIDSPKFWAGYRAKYAVKAVAAQAPAPLQAPLSADPGQELPPAQGPFSGVSEEAEGGIGEAKVGQSGAEIPMDVDTIAESMPDATGADDVSPDMAVSAAQVSEFTVVPEGNQVIDEVIAQPQAANDQGWDATLPANPGASVEPVDLPQEDTHHLTPPAEAPGAPAIAATAVTEVLATDLPQPEDSEVTADSEAAVPPTQSNIINQTTPTPAIPNPNTLTPDEQAKGNELYQLWEETMATEWRNYPAKIRLIMLRFLQNEVEAEAHEERRAA